MCFLSKSTSEKADLSWCFLWWFCNPSFLLNVAPQLLHLCGFSEEWESTWAKRPLFVANNFLQRAHSHPFFPGHLCLCTESFCLHHFPHASHEYALGSALWTFLTCDLRFCSRGKVCSQIPHMNGFSCVWKFMLCSSRPSLLLKLFPQRLQENGFISTCRDWCLMPHKIGLLTKCLLALSTLKGLFSSMDSLMYFQTWGLGEMFVTIWTWIWLLFIVDPHVYFQVKGAAKVLFAKIAGKWFFSIVNILMCS